MSDVRSPPPHIVLLFMIVVWWSSRSDFSTFQSLRLHNILDLRYSCGSWCNVGVAQWTKLVIWILRHKSLVHTLRSARSVECICYCITVFSQCIRVVGWLWRYRWVHYLGTFIWLLLTYILASAGQWKSQHNMAQIAAVTAVRNLTNWFDTSDFHCTPWTSLVLTESRDFIMRLRKRVGIQAARSRLRLALFISNQEQKHQPLSQMCSYEWEYPLHACAFT